MISRRKIAFKMVSQICESPTGRHAHIPNDYFVDVCMVVTTVLLYSGLEFRNIEFFIEFLCNTYVDNRVADSLMHIVIIMNVSRYYCSKLKLILRAEVGVRVNNH